MAKVLCVLSEDPVAGFPPPYARDDIPVLKGYPDGQTMPSPAAIDFQPGQLLGSVSGELGLRPFVEASGHELVVTADKDGAGSEFDRHLPDAEVVISQPFWPAYLTAERMQKAAPQDRHHRRYRVGPRRPRRRHRARSDRGRGDLLQQHQRCRARRDDDPFAGAQLSAVPPDRARRWLEHRGLRFPVLRPGRHARRHGRRRENRSGGAPSSQALRRTSPLHGPSSPAARDRGRNSVSRSTRRPRTWFRIATS